MKVVVQHSKMTSGRDTMVLLGLGLLLSGHTAAPEPNVSCLIVGQNLVQCTWNGCDPPGVNYTFQSRFDNEVLSQCSTYIQEQGVTRGCNQTHKDSLYRRFRSFYTLLTYKNKTFPQEHNIMLKVKLNPPANLTVTSNSEELRLHWNNSHPGKCIQNEVRHRKQNKNWQRAVLNPGRTDFLISSVSSRERYELQVRSRMGPHCHTSLYWSGWSPSAFWGPLRNSTARVDKDVPGLFVSWGIPVVCGVAGFALLLLLALVSRSERLRALLLPVVPSPSRNLSALLDVYHGNVEEWLNISKELKEGFKSNYLELPCPVRDYNSQPCPVRHCNSQRCLVKDYNFQQCPVQDYNSQPCHVRNYNSQVVHESHSTNSSITTDQSDGCMSVSTDQSDGSMSISTDHSECLSSHCCTSTSSFSLA